MLRSFAPLALWAALIPACERRPERAVEPPPRIATYEARGAIRKINLASHSAVIAHEAIRGYMEAMAMELDAADAHELDGFQSGDVVTFRLSVDDTRSWIDRLRKVGTVALPPPEEKAESALPPNAPAPDCALVDSAGRRFRVSDFRGQALVVSFFFTRCP